MERRRRAGDLPLHERSRRGRLGLSRADVRRRLGRDGGPGDRQRRRRLRRRDRRLRPAERRPACIEHRAGLRNGPAEPHRARTRGRGGRTAVRVDRRFGGHRLERRARTVTGSTRIVEVAELDFAFEPKRWSFAEAEADRIASHWAELRERKPALFNGRVLLLGRRELASCPGGGLRLAGAYFETDYANFVAWRDLGRLGDAIENCFSMAALRGADGAFLLGEMAPHTMNAGKTYFPAGTPDPADIFDGKVDLDASARRELLEETGIAADEAAIRPDWTVVFAPGRI